MRIHVLDDIENAVRGLACVGRLTGHDLQIWTDHVSDIDTLARRLQDADAIVPLRGRTRFTEALLSRLPRLKIISQTGAVPHIDLDACTRQGVVVSSLLATRTPYGTAELAWGLVIAAMRDIAPNAAALRAGQWRPTMGRNLRGRTLGVLGYGRVGAVVAGFGRAFGMNVLVWNRNPAPAQADGFETASDRAELFARADVLSLHLRLTDATRGSIGADDLERMKPTALLVNTARAELIAPGALLQALREGRPGRAALDVFEREPLPAADPLLHLDQVLCTPHLGYVEEDSHEYAFGHAFDQINAFAAGAPAHVCNPTMPSTPGT